MKTGLKITLWATGVLAVLGVSGYFIGQSIKKTKYGKLYAEDEAKRIAAEQEAKAAAELAALNPPKVDTIAPMFNTLPPIPTDFLGGMGMGSTISKSEPTPEEYIRMADRWMTWENIWKFAEKLGITDKNLIGGVGEGSTATYGNNANAILNNASRKKFNSEIVAKYPNWKSLVKTKAELWSIPLNSQQIVDNSTAWLKSKFGIDMAAFNGNNTPIKDFWAR